MDILASLNPEQRQAVVLPAEHALILAGAGSGKTRVLTTRIAWLISEGRARASEILAVTFTNKAAREMKTRLEAMLGAGVGSMWVGTFHGIAHRFLRLHASEAGLPKTFQIIDQADQLSILKAIMKDKGLGTEKEDAKQIQGEINRAKEKGMRAQQFSRINLQGPSSMIYTEYETRCKRDGLVDFAELLLATVELFEKNAHIREHYANRFKFILVDEFQDTNVLQYRWIKTLSAPGKDEAAVFCVGDDDQSIYAFRGACVGNMSDFVKDYKVPHIVKLEQNYRSTSHILDAANAVISHNKERMGKKLWTSAGKGEPIGVYAAADDNDEARSIVQEIQIQHRLGRPYADFAVLYRNNAQSRVIEQFFTSNSVPYRIYGGLRFFDRHEIKDVMAYLRVISKPDDLSIERVINHPPRGIGTTTVDRIKGKAQSLGLGLWDVLTGSTEDEEAKALVGRAAKFVHLIEDIREKNAESNLVDLVKNVITASGLREYYEKQIDKAIRLENLDELIGAAAAYCEENDIEEADSAFATIDSALMPPLDGFISQAVLESEGHKEENGTDAVQMMTVHASKGLEFNSVFLTGLERGIFPHPAKSLNEKDRIRSDDEERRLLYVAMTRAKKYLRISYCALRRQYGDLKFTGPSQFLEEIPASEAVWIKKESELGAFSDRRAPSYSRGYERDSSYRERSRREPMRDSFFAVPSSKRKEAENPWGLKKGDRVRHRKFGDGTVISLANAMSQETATAWVQFPCGKKELMLCFAKLEKIS